VIPVFIDAALRGAPMLVHGDGQQTRDFTYVGTVVNVLAEAVLGRVTSPVPVNLAFGTRVTILDVARSIAAAIGVAPDIRHCPTRPGDVRDSQAECGRLLDLFMSVKPVELDEGLGLTIEWFQRLADYKHSSNMRPAYGPRSMPSL